MKRSPSSCSSSGSSPEFHPPPPAPPPPPPPPLKQESKIKRPRRNNQQKPRYISSSGGRSSIYRGVTRHRWTGRYEAHLWDKGSWNPIQNKKGRQVYLGAYDDEEAAAHTYDLAALKYWGPETILNFPFSTYKKEYEAMQCVPKEGYLAMLRRKSSGFARGVSKYRGVARHHHNGRWEARIGRVFGNKYLYLGTYSTQEEAAEAYDLAALEYRGLNAVTNFDISRYHKQLKPHLQRELLLQQQLGHFQNSNRQQQIITTELCESQKEPSAQRQISNLETPDSSNHDHDDDHHHHQTNQSSNVINPTEEHPWNNLCMEPRFNPNPVPVGRIAVEEKRSELPELFNYSGFEESIDFFFDGSKESGVSLDGIFETSGAAERGYTYIGVDEKKAVESGLMGEGLASASASTTTSVSYPFPISICT